MLGLELQQRWQPGVGVKARPCGVEVLTPPQPSGTISRPSMTSWAAAIASREKQMDIFGNIFCARALSPRFVKRGHAHLHNHFFCIFFYARRGDAARWGRPR
jgi:hypothetical protein